MGRWECVQVTSSSTVTLLKVSAELSGQIVSDLNVCIFIYLYLPRMTTYVLISHKQYWLTAGNLARSLEDR